MKTTQLFNTINISAIDKPFGRFILLINKYQKSQSSELFLSNFSSEMQISLVIDYRIIFLGEIELLILNPVIVCFYLEHKSTNIKVMLFL